jgi:iron complex outermembrane recepter protein
MEMIRIGPAQLKTRIRRRALLLAAAAAGGTAQPAFAQQAEADEDITVTGQRATAATKTDTPIIEVPQAISVISAEQIRDRTVVDFQDVYRYNAGVSANASVDGRGDFVTTRGFDATQYLDGLKRLPNFIYGARLDPFTLARAELLRGPSSVLYGASGPGGVLNGASKIPEFDLAGLAGVYGGTDDRIQGQVDVTGGLSQHVAVRLVGLARDAKTQWGTPDDRLLANPSVRFRLSENTDITLIGLYQKDTQGSLGYTPYDKSRLNGDRSTRVRFNFYQGEPGFNRTDVEFKSGAAIWSQRLNDVLTFRSVSRYTDINTDYREVYLNYTANPYADAARTLHKREFYVNYERTEVFNTDNNFSAELVTGPVVHKLLWGVDYLNFKQTRDEGFSYDGLVLPGSLPFASPPPINVYTEAPTGDFAFGAFNASRFRNTQLGLYLQDQMSVADRLHVVMGIRRDRATGLNERAKVAWSFRGGVIAEVIKGLSPYFNYSESFVPVSGGSFLGVPYLPQTARQYEGGVKWQPTAGALLSVAYSDIVEDNRLSQDPSNIQNFLQGGTVGSKGVEVEASIRRPRNYDLTAAYSYVDATFLTATTTSAEGDRVASQPRHTASVWGSKTLAFGADWEVNASAGVRYIGNKIDLSQTLTTPDVTLVDAALRVARGSWELSVTGSNILNKRYYDFCTVAAPTNAYCIAAKDRTIIAGLARRL